MKAESLYVETEVSRDEEDFKLNEDFFDIMDKEVEEELDNEDTDSSDEKNPPDENSNEPTDLSDKKVSSQLSLEAESSSSSLNSFDDESIDDEMILALERDLENKN